MHRYDAFIGGFLLTVAIVYGSVLLGVLALYLITYSGKKTCDL